MISRTLLKLFVLAALLLGPVPAAVLAGPVEPPADPLCRGPVNPGAGVESLSGSYVVFDPSAGGDTSYCPGVPQTFCFRAHTFTGDWEYVYHTWLKFPTDWTVTNVYVVGTPACSGGGTWGSFDWSFETSPYEVNISHPRYQAFTDDCVAYYCVDIIPGGVSPFPEESWYYDGDGYNNPPHHPCSYDHYTPPSMSAEPCDEAVNPPAMIPGCCPADGVYLLPETQEGEGCNGEPLVYHLSVYNVVGADWTFDLAYSVIDGLGTLSGPATIFVPYGDVTDLQVTLTPDVCAQPGGAVAGQVDVSGNGYTDTATISHDVTGGGGCPSCDLRGSLEGTVLDGDGGLAPACTGATVTVNPGSLVVSVDPATGAYGPLDLVQGDYVVEATAPGYSIETAAVTIVDAMTTTQDLSLYRPVAGVEPPSISVSAPPNTPVVVPLTVSNLGHLPLEWEIVEISPAVRAQARAAANSTKQAPAAIGLDPLILEQMALAADGKADLFVAFKDTADLSAAHNAKGKEAKVQTVRALLKAAADKAQSNVRAWLDRQGVDYQVFTIDNTLLIKADRATLDKLAAFPEVSGFRGNHSYQLLPAGISAMQKAGGDATIPWDLTIMNIPQVWDELGVTGEGAIVANVDTGVDYDHEALYPNYLCGSGPHTDCWLDPDGGTTTPYDGSGHGTTTMSQMAADNSEAFQYAVGGAPDAGWIACLGCPGGSCPDTALNACADWLVSGTPNTPDIVNNPWGTWPVACDSWYSGKLQAYRAAGIVPVFAAGGIGNACGTSTSPANNSGTFAVGATNSSDMQASFSSTGPGPCPGRTQFPDVVAPGDPTCGAVSGGGYSCNLSGTSFAASLAASCLALVKSANPELTVGELEDVVMATADDKPNTDCGSPQDDPNYRYGDGRVNCFEAVSAVYNAGLPWVSETPVSGTLPALGYQPVEITFECTPDQDGLVLTGTLRLDHNDPCAGPVGIPIEMACGTLAPPDVDVQPSALASTQPQNEVTIQHIDIHNNGTENLIWTIVEHNPGAICLPAPETAAATIPPALPLVGAPAEGRTRRTVQLTLDGAGGPSVETSPPAALGLVNLVLDDGSRENDIGLGGTVEMLWVNRFTPSPEEFPFELDQIQVYFSSAGLVNAGDDIVLVVYENTSGSPDPAAGSTFLAGFPTTVQALDAWNVYDLATPVLLSGPGDVIIGVIGMEVPGTSYWPAAIDQTTTQARSWAGWWNSSPPPTPPVLPPDNWTLIDAYFPGNWMVRGYGGAPCCIPPPCEPVDIPWASVDPVSGTTPGGAGFLVDVTFDSTGLAPGTYTANLCVQSNDLDESYVVVPLTMTVQAPPAIAVTPSSLSAELCPDSTETQPITLCNTGDLPLQWSLGEVPGTVSAAGGTSGLQVSRPVRLDLDPASQVGSVPADVRLYPDSFQLILDDGSRENDIGIGGTLEMIWVNRFTPGPHQFPVNVVQIQVYFSSVGLVDVGDDIVLVVYDNTSGNTDPAVGSTFLASFPVTVGVLDAWNIYNLPTPVIFNGPGDVILGVIAMEVPGTSYWPAAIDQTTTQARSWAGWWNASPPPDPPLLPPPNWTLIDAYFPGNWMVRGFGECGGCTGVPWLSEVPTGGTLPADECVTVAVTFDPTGMAPGDYRAGLLIDSNDPAQPEITVPVSLTVPAPAEILSVDYIVTGLQVAFDAAVTGTLPLTYSWDFGDGAVANIEDPTHIYTVGGCYTVTLVADNACGQARAQVTVCVESPYHHVYVPVVLRAYTP